MIAQAGSNNYLAKGYEKHAWILLFIEGITGVIFGFWFMTGVEPRSISAA